MLMTCYSPISLFCKMHAGADRILQLQLATDNVGATIETYQTLCATEIAMEACKEALAS